MNKSATTATMTPINSSGHNISSSEAEKYAEMKEMFSLSRADTEARA